MGLFSKLLQKNNNDNDPEFDAQYEKLKNLASEIVPYEYSGMSDAMRAPTIVSLCDEFTSIASRIDSKKALNCFSKEAKVADPKSSVPFHPIFRCCATGREDAWEYVVRSIKSIGAKYSKWYQGVCTFNERLNSIPSATVQLSDDHVLRNNMLLMPEIKYASVGKSFNKDALVRFVVVDTETTGLKASNGRIVQLSAIKYGDWEPVEIWSTYIDPGKVKIEADATKINGITNEMVAGKPTIKQVAHSFMDFVGDCSVVGYNLPFDLKFLYAEGIDLTNIKRKYFDVLALAKKCYKSDLDFFSLEDVAEYNRIYFIPHNSLHDCLATGDIFERIVDDITG